jgi:hypothetical protein
MRAETADAKARTPEVPGGERGSTPVPRARTKAVGGRAGGMKREAQELEEPNAHPSISPGERKPQRPGHVVRFSV